MSLNMHNSLEKYIYKKKKLEKSTLRHRYCQLILASTELVHKIFLKLAFS